MKFEQEQVRRELRSQIGGVEGTSQVDEMNPWTGARSPRIALRQTPPDHRREDWPTLAMSVFWLWVIVFVFLCGCGALFISAVRVSPKGAAAPPRVLEIEPEFTATPEPSPTRVVETVPVMAKVIEDRVNLRAEPSTEAEIVGKLERDDQITLIGRSVDGKWYQANITGQNEKGWVFAETLEIVSGNPEGLPVINTSNP